MSSGYTSLCSPSRRRLVHGEARPRVRVYLEILAATECRRSVRPWRCPATAMSLAISSGRTTMRNSSASGTSAAACDRGVVGRQIQGDRPLAHGPPTRPPRCPARPGIAGAHGTFSAELEPEQRRRVTSLLVPPAGRGSHDRPARPISAEPMDIGGSTLGGGNLDRLGLDCRQVAEVPKKMALGATEPSELFLRLEPAAGRIHKHRISLGGSLHHLVLEVRQTAFSRADRTSARETCCGAAAHRAGRAR